MTKPEPTQSPLIELELDNQSQYSSIPSRRNRPLVQEAQHVLPKIEPIVGESDIGSDRAEYTVGVFFLLSAIPGIISLLSGNGAGGLLGIAIPIYLGIGLLRRDDFVHQWIFAICLVQLVVGPLSLIFLPSSRYLIIGGMIQNASLLVLVSGKALSKQVYVICISGVSLGVIISTIACFIH